MTATQVTRRDLGSLTTSIATFFKWRPNPSSLLRKAAIRRTAQLAVPTTASGESERYLLPKKRLKECLYPQVDFYAMTPVQVFEFFFDDGFYRHLLQEARRYIQWSGEAMVKMLVDELPRQMREDALHLYVDNLFTSLPLMKALKEEGIGCTGTIRQNRPRGCP